jgi:hypothetical protein
MLADSKREIERALDLANEFGLKAIIAGGEEAWMVADRLKKENVPVIATLNFPRRTAAPDPDADPEPIRTLQARVDIPRNPGKLATAGVKVAFTSAGINMTDYLGNVRKAVAAGMNKDAALRSLTLTPAEMFGVADRLGSIEQGKIANLTITRGDLFESGRVTNVFVDGRPVTVRVAADNANANLGASGTWTITATFAEGDRAVTLNLTQEGERLRGNIQGPLGAGDISNGSISAAGELRFSASVTLGGTSEEANFSGTMTGTVMRGSIQIIGHPNGTFVGTRLGAGGGQGRGGQRPPPQSSPASR